MSTSAHGAVAPAFAGVDLHHHYSAVIVFVDIAFSVASSGHQDNEKDGIREEKERRSRFREKRTFSMLGRRYTALDLCSRRIV